MHRAARSDTKKGKFEIMSAVVDSGATVPVMSPNTTARPTSSLESEASRRGVRVRARE
jgi:hypothetical protein